MDRSITAIRPFTPTIAGYQAIAAITSAFPPEQIHDFEPASTVDLQALDIAFHGANRPIIRYVAEQAGRVVGYASAFEIDWAPPTGRYWLTIRVLPEYQHQGVGHQLYARVCADFTSLGARAVQAEMHESLANMADSLLRLGFHELLRSWLFVLEPCHCDLARFRAALERVLPLQIITLDRLRERDPGYLPKLYKLNTILSYDVPIPSYPLPHPPLAWFAEQVGRLPTACFVVCDGDQYVGLSYLHTNADTPDVLSQRMTGVLRAYRGRGVAMALKLNTIAFAQQHGYRAIYTGVESNNIGMLAINAQLGFVQGSGIILFEKQYI